MSHRTVVKIKHTVHVHPQYLGAALCAYIERETRAHFEKKWTEQRGYVESIVIDPIGCSAGLINTRTGFVDVDVDLMATVYKPEQGQLVTTIIESIDSFGVHAYAGPLRMFVAKQMLARKYRIEKHQLVGRHEGEEQTLQVGDSVRLRIIGTSWVDGAYFSIAQLAED